MLYSWKSTALRGYYLGTIVSVGENINVARINAKAEFLNYLVSERFWRVVLSADGVPEDDDYRKDWIDLVALFDSDIAAEPRTSLCALINGGD